MITFAVAQDIYRHFKNDDGKMPAARGPATWLDAVHKPLWQLLETQPEQFHLHCVSTPQQYRIEEHLPLVWFSVAAQVPELAPAGDTTMLAVSVRVFAADPTGAVNHQIAHRVQCLLDRRKDDQILWNACPLLCRYGQFLLRSITPVEPCSFGDRVYRVILTFTGNVQAQTDARGLPLSYP
jgi:hypothetical protein